MSGRVALILSVHLLLWIASWFIFRCCFGLSHAVVCSITFSIVSSLLYKHCRFNTCNSISAKFNQLPCFGVYTNSNRSHSPLAWAAGNASYKDPGLCVFTLSKTNVIFLAAGQLSEICPRKWAQSILVRRSVTFIIRFPAKGSLAIRIEHTPHRRYS